MIMETKLGEAKRLADAMMAKMQERDMEMVQMIEENPDGFATILKVAHFLYKSEAPPPSFGQSAQKPLSKLSMGFRARLYMQAFQMVESHEIVEAALKE